MTDFVQSLRIKLQAILPDGSIYAGEASFAISMADEYDYNILGDDDDQDDLHGEFVKLSVNLAQNLQSRPPDAMDGSLAESDDTFEDGGGSNFIESADAGLDITTKICHSIFKGEANIYLRGKNLNEQTILETHGILTKGIDTDQGYSWTQYSGVYRQVSVVAGLHAFPRADQVPAAMRRMIWSLSHDLQAAAREGIIDPIALTSKYCHIFVNVHPFVDGNGRRGDA
ncbi:hypothetical protein B0T24DRAFT_589392 [Lasiosphaeria ovina]|uniref:Fido domain-containing protein n=1 Tax=Lasiosphaeria ovina TaxID=92902 RepID=A0AAE0KMD4_9PEZI|nr:hypothetical protein B0T24DRAFT_589392 [Lasiosphaeria ovina]